MSASATEIHRGSRLFETVDFEDLDPARFIHLNMNTKLTKVADGKRVREKKKKILSQRCLDFIFFHAFSHIHYSIFMFYCYSSTRTLKYKHRLFSFTQWKLIMAVTFRHLRLRILSAKQRQQLLCWSFSSWDSREKCSVDCQQRQSSRLQQCYLVL